MLRRRVKTDYWQICNRTNQSNRTERLPGMISGSTSGFLFSYRILDFLLIPAPKALQTLSPSFFQTPRKKCLPNDSSGQPISLQTTQNLEMNNLCRPFGSKAACVSTTATRLAATAVTVFQEQRGDVTVPWETIVSRISQHP